VRDAQTSAEDLQNLLDRRSHDRDKPEGAMLFACMGRGKDLYGEPDVDAKLFQKRFGAVPLGGFFCNGEIGPVNGSTYLHGYTSCFGLFGPRKS
jgi:small ligand-binding sensory domain FIST